MGAYWIFANRTRRVYLDPDDIDSGTAKRWQVVNSPEVARVLAWVMTGPWCGDNVTAMADEGDTAAECDTVEENWRNVTSELLAEMSAECGETIDAEGVEVRDVPALPVSP